MRDDNTTIIRHEVLETSFSFFTSEEVRRLSIKQISSPVAFDALNHPVPGGLYDPALGPVEPHAICVTCHLSQKDCPGHMGHIELAQPVYHPMLLPTLFKLLRKKCFNCHRFKMAEHQVRRYRVKLMLLDAGELTVALDLEKELAPKKTLEEMSDGKQKYEDSDLARMQEVLDKYERYARRRKVQSLPGHVRMQRQQVADQFFKDIPSIRCHNCGAISPGLRKDGHTKIFQKPLSDKAQRAMNTLNIKLSDALKTVGHNEDDTRNSDDSDEDDAEEEEVTLDNDDKKKPKYLHPLEVQSQIQLLWEKEESTLQLLFPSTSADSRGHESFFLRVVPVPPARFRPPTTLGELTFEHPQNVYLTKVLQLNEKMLQVDEYSRRQRAEAQEKAGDISDAESPSLDLSQVLSVWIDLQNAINCFMDSSRDSSNSRDMPNGIRQLLEKKEGLFRKHMMGKRVNYAARSVISPDPYISTSEIGIPQRFARKLTYPQPVTPWNVVQLRQAVVNGPDSHPGANFVEDERGRLVDLSKRTPQQRIALSKTLLTRSQSDAGVAGVKKVWRHLHTGDVLLVNRQPTLHKPSIMAHKARVLHNPKEQTIRMHYANCNTFNADFDGDEINLHFPQNELARAEAYNIAANDYQYIVPTNGKPIRGLIQDHVDAGVKLTQRDTFLTKDEYMQILFAACCGLEGLELPTRELKTLPPAILKPQPMWTGKQVISTLLLNFTQELPKLNLDSKSKTPATAYGAENQEHIVIVREGELLQGVLDKGQFGATEYGLVHAVYELYGAKMAADLLSVLGRLFTVYLQFAGHTCGIEDLTLTADAEEERRKLIVEADVAGELASADWAGATDILATVGSARRALTAEEKSEVSKKLRQKLLRDPNQDNARSLDSHIMGVVSGAASSIIKACLPAGQEKKFPENCFSLMVNTGAKGSMVNHSQISCGLGQQALEGRRVPIMISGKALPSLRPYEPSPRAGGFVTDRFLTGIRPQEYYFHCMAGREGLVDTAVKTSRSGYLQRCLIKHLEDLRVQYDYTVRNSEGSVVQFLYGEDSLDVLETKYLVGKDDQMAFVARNTGALGHKYSLHGEFFASTGFDMNASLKAHRAIELTKTALSENQLKVGTLVHARRKRALGGKWKAGGIMTGWYPAEIISSDPEKGTLGIRYTDTGEEAFDVPRQVKSKGSRVQGGGQCMSGVIDIVRPSLPDPVMHTHDMSKNVGVVSESMQEKIREYINKNPHGLLDTVPLKNKKKKKKKKTSDDNEEDAMQPKGLVSPMGFELLMWVKYMRSLAQPGESVGIIAAQSVGEPSTQMTLNTFHLAGHGGANVTLGIPRLREIIMTASKKISTPSMTIPLASGVPKKEADRITRQLYRLRLKELLSLKLGTIVKETLKQRGDIESLWVREYVIRLNFFPMKTLAKAHDVDHDDIMHAVGFLFLPKLLSIINMELKRAGDIAVGTATPAQEAIQAERASRKKPVQADDEEDDEEQGTLRFGRKNEMAGYGEMDEEDVQIQHEASKAVDRLTDDEDDEAPKKSQKSHSKARMAPSLDDTISDPDQEVGFDDAPKKNASYGDKSTVVLEVSHSASRNKYFSTCLYNREEGWAEIKLQLPSQFRKLLMVGLVERAADLVLVRHSPGIKQCFLVDQKIDGVDVTCLQTQGVNFQKMWELSDYLDVNRLDTNDIYQVLITYGVEAARALISRQITAVFGVYGISVDPRHLSLIADYMTFGGDYTPMNRAGMANNPSPFLQMTFETTMKFLTAATLQGMYDDLKSPSAKIVLGQPVPAGTGGFELLQPIKL